MTADSSPQPVGLSAGSRQTNKLSASRTASNTSVLFSSANQLRPRQTGAAGAHRPATGTVPLISGPPMSRQVRGCLRSSANAQVQTQTSLLCWSYQLKFCATNSGSQICFTRDA
jgi:hypothetical protein